MYPTRDGDMSCSICGHVEYVKPKSLRFAKPIVLRSSVSEKAETESEIRDAVKWGWTNGRIMGYFGVSLQTAERQRKKVKDSA
jgi:hypothetical protein|tara:strand:+ start:100 stop:348 length:249 start_codon:yes stop_codon:yes gene_type:complete